MQNELYPVNYCTLPKPCAVKGCCSLAVTKVRAHIQHHVRAPPVKTLRLNQAAGPVRSRTGIPWLAPVKPLQKPVACGISG
ncbi:unnamed protein product [Calypogeia fissa]